MASDWIKKLRNLYFFVKINNNSLAILVLFCYYNPVTYRSKLTLIATGGR